MKLSAISKGIAAIVVALAASAPAHAGYVIVDGWQLNTDQTGLDTNIGHLTLEGGGATVQQEVNGSGNVFVGAKFSEAGFIFSARYVPENSIGNGDTGFGAPLDTVNFGGLEIVFSNVYGSVSDVFAQGFSYDFLGGDFLIRGVDINGVATGNYASGSIIGIGGTGATTNVIGGTAGSSNLLALVGTVLDPDFDVRDSSGASIIADLLGGKYLFQATTTNTVDQTSGVASPCVDTSNVDFAAGALCANFSVTSEGALNVVEVVPEPASLALVGLGLLGAAFARRRKS